MLLAEHCVSRTSFLASAAAVGFRRARPFQRLLVQSRGMFVQKLNPLTGEADWVLVNDPGLGDEDDASADLVATSSYLDMLTDTRRNVAYNAALRRVLPALQRQRQLQQHQRTAAAAAAAPMPVAAATALDQPNEGGSGGSSGGGGATTAVPGPLNEDLVRVLDIGTGTGLLAMMAARALGHEPAAAATAGEPAATAVGGAGLTDDKGKGASQDAPPSAPVVACEVFPPMQNLARRVLAANGLERVIRVVNKRSDEIVVRPPGDGAAAGAAGVAAPGRAAAAAAAARARAAAAAAGTAATGPDMYGKVDVIVTEIFDSELLGEGMIPTMRHAVQYLLKEGGVVIPATSRVYGQVVQCPLMHRMTGLRLAGDGSRKASTGFETVESAWLVPRGVGSSTDGGGHGNPQSDTTSSAAAPAYAAASSVLGVLADLDARARAAFYRGAELYEVREMHVDLLHQYDEARRCGRNPGRSEGATTQGSVGLQKTADGIGPDAAAHQQDAHYGQQGQGQQQEEEQAVLLHPLSQPFLVFDFDWLRPPPPSGRRMVVEVPVTAAGSAHAVLLWWQLGMTPEDGLQLKREPTISTTSTISTTTTTTSTTGENRQAEQPPPQPQQPPQPAGHQTLLLSTAPYWVGDRHEVGADGGPLEGVAQRWRDHWKQCWSQLADDAPTVQRGDVLRLAFEHDDLNIRLKMLSQPPPAPAAAAAAPSPEATAGTVTAGAGGGTAAEAPAPAAAAAPAPAAGGGRSAKEVLESLRAEAEAEGAAGLQQLMPLLSWLGPQALLQLGDLGRLTTFGAALQAALAEAGAASGGDGGGAEVVVVDGSLALGLLAATHPAVASVTLLQESNLAAGNWLRAAACRLGVATKIRSVRSETYFKRLAAARPQPATISAPFAPSPSSSTAVNNSSIATNDSDNATSLRPAGPGPMVLVSEPYFSEFEQLVPWAHLKFWRDFDVIRGSAAVAVAAAPAGGSAGGGVGAERRVALFPKRARLMAVAASLPELWRTRYALGRIEGLDLSAANAVLGVVGGGADEGAVQYNSADGTAGKAAGGDSDEDVWGADSDEEGREGATAGGGGGGGAGGGRQPLPILPYSIWQAGGGYEELSGRQELLCLNCDGHLDDMEGGAVLTVQRSAMCHAIVLWMDFDLASSQAAAAAAAPLTVSTAPAADGGPGPSVQGLYLLRQPVDVTRGSRLHVAATFDGLDADVSVEVTVVPQLEGSVM